MRIMFSFLFFIAVPILACGQIQTTIGDFETDINLYFGPQSRFFVGSFHFQSKPRPLEPCKVDFILEISKEEPSISANDWEVMIARYDYAVRIIGDTVFRWAGPHKVGARLTGTIEFIPLQSGVWGITLYYHHPVRNTYYEYMQAGIGFRWCLSPDGELRYLGKGPGMPDGCMSVNSTFFKGDSIIIYDSPGPNGDGPFEYTVLIEPQPRIADTADIHFFLRARQDISTGCNLSIDVGSMELINQPEKMNFAIFKDQLIERSFKVIPRPIRNGHGITCQILCVPAQKLGYEYSQMITCSFIFNNDSTLRYVNYEDHNYDYDHVEKVKNTLFPNAFPWATGSDRKHIEIKGDSVETY